MSFSRTGCFLWPQSENDMAYYDLGHQLMPKHVAATFPQQWNTHTSSTGCLISSWFYLHPTENTSSLEATLTPLGSRVKIRTYFKKWTVLWPSHCTELGKYKCGVQCEQNPQTSNHWTELFTLEELTKGWIVATSASSPTPIISNFSN